MAISRWQPGSPVLSVRDMMNQLWDESVWWPMRAGAAMQAFQAPFDVYADGDGYTVEVNLPGFKPEDIDIQLVGSSLTISGEVPHEAPEGRQYIVRQRPFGSFKTSLTLPEAADAANVTARFEHGVLSVYVPKSETAKPKRIQLTAGK